MKMKKNGPESRNRFWLVLISLNVLAMVYPLSLIWSASSVDGQLIAAIVLIGVVFLLVVIDMISILVVDAMDEPMGRKKPARIRPF